MAVVPNEQKTSVLQVVTFG